MSSINNLETNYVYVENVAGRIEIINDAGTKQTSLITDNDTDLRVKFTTPNNVVRYSPFFKFGNIRGKAKSEPAALVEQLTYLGYNTVSGALDATANKYFGIKIALDHQYNIGNNSPIMKTVPFYSTQASQLHIASGIMESGIAQFQRDAQRFIQFDRVSDGTFTEFTNDCSVIYRGKAVSCTAHGVSAGGYVRLRGATYVAESVTTNSITLDMPYQGVTETIDVSATADLAGSIASPANWGVRFSGITPLNEFKPVVDTPYVVRFTLETPEFDVATVTRSTTPNLGTGTFQQVSFIESQAQFEEKDRYVQAYPPNRRDIDAVSGDTYQVVSFTAFDNTYSSPTTGNAPISKFHFTLAIENDISGNYDGLDTVLGIA